MRPAARVSTRTLCGESTDGEHDGPLKFDPPPAKGLDSSAMTVRNGVPWQEFTRNEQLGSAFRARHSVPGDAFVFGMIARLTYLKGIDVALHALHLLLEQGVGR